MKKTEDAIVAYLERYGQPQSYQAIAAHLEDHGYVDYTKEDVDALVESGLINKVEDGVDNRGEPMIWYAPVSTAGVSDEEPA